ncbi:MAG: hypothetical protein Q9164_002151 [Protoblastenia rupestris]
MYLKSLASALVALAPLVYSAAIDLQKRADVTVTLSAVEKTVVKASIKNTAAEELRLLKGGTFLDDAPVYKATVFKDGAALPFEGVLVRLKTSELTEDAFLTIAPGETAERTFDLAAVTDLSAGGNFEIASEGAIPLATSNLTELSGDKIYYRSNTLSVNVDGAEAARVAPAVKPLDRRTNIASCSGTRLTALQNALSNSVRLSNNAANAAQSGSASKFSEYFKTTDSGTRTSVANRFRAVASQSSTTNSGSTTYYCTDPYGYCSPNVLAYTIPSRNIIANCGIYYSNLPALTTTCHRQDQATTTIHEFCHAPGVYSPGTVDNGYGYSAATALTASQALANADTYSLYANAIYVGC